MARIILLLSALLVLGSASAALDGNTFLSEEHKTDAAQGYWLGYVTAISQAMVDGIIIDDELFTACFGDSKAQQWLDVVKKYVLDNPEHRHAHMYFLTVLAIGTAFPCTESAQ